MTAPAPQPWDQQPGETAKAFAGFASFRDLGTARSIQAAADQLGRSRATLAEWSLKHAWVARVAEWDREQDRIRQEAQHDAVRAMAERHAREAHAGQQVAMAPIRAVLEVIAQEQRENGGRSPTLEGIIRESPQDALQLALAAATKLPALQQAERLARGEPTEIIAAAHLNLTPPSPAELAAIWEAVSRTGLIPPPAQLEQPEDDAE